MIKSANNSSFFDQTKRVLILISADTIKNDIRELKQNIRQHFKTSVEITYLVFYNEKKVPDSVTKSSDVFYCSKREFSFFGKLKSTPIRKLIFKEKHDLLIACVYKKNKSINKLISWKKATVKVGLNRNTLPKFDLAFEMKKNDYKKLIEQTVKYLKKIEK